MQKRTLKFQHLVCGSYYTALSCDIIYGIFVLFTVAYVKVEVIWFDTLGHRPKFGVTSHFAY